MTEHVTILRPAARLADGRGVSSAFPSDVNEQVRSRVQLLALLLLVAFAFDLVVYLGTWASILAGYPAPADFGRSGGFQAVNLTAVVASAVLWYVARSRRVSPSRLHSLGLAYEIAICLSIATLTYWQFFLSTGILPHLTWVPAIVILFPLLMPGPPRRMLAASIAAGATVPLALFALDRLGQVFATSEGYVQATVGSAFAVGFAYMGARVVYGLGREVAAARELGSYRLVERLGQGGMGEVWRAQHRLLVRPAAIKLIRPPAAEDARPGASSEARERFEREAQAMSQLRSPHTVTLFDFGVAADGAFYYVMELLDGLDADGLVRRTGPVPSERAIHLLRQICHSLSEAESRGLVHRDIKPANIFVCRYGEDDDFVKVLDFGIVKGMREAPGATVTQDDVVRGTPAFMAPEQAVGASAIDGRADIYATGCLAFWLLTGQLVFTADTPMGILLHHAHTAPTPPSARTEQPIPPALDALVLSCLAKDPALRPQSATELSRRLAAIEGADAWTGRRARDWWNTHMPIPAAGPAEGERTGRRA